MQAVAFSEFGGPEVLRIVDRPTPEPRPGAVVVDVVAASINPTDIMMLRGEHARMMTDLAPPFIAGMEFAGRVSKVGQGVDLEVGEPVIGVVNPRRPEGGAQAQQVRVPATLVAAIDEKIDLTAAAAVPMNALTGMLALELLGLSPGQTLLVTGGTGIMGSLTIPLARQAGLIVLANGAEADRAFLMGLGAHIVLPRNAGLEDTLLAAYPHGIDGMIDGALIGRQLSHLVRDGGGAVALRGTHAIDDARLRTFVVSVGKAIQETDDMKCVHAMIEQIARYIEDGSLTPRIPKDGVFGYADAARAYEMAERGGFRGRVMLNFR
jgi:NADPH:quinone reductase-like Zn-dependent oxidoreductase